MPKLRPWMSKAILERRLEGISFREIGEEFGLSHQRMHQLLEPEDRAVFDAHIKKIAGRKKRMEVAFRRYKKRRYWINKPEDRFWENVDIRGSDECWEWKMARQPQKGYEYGKLQWGGKHAYAHRVAWSLFNKREIPDKMFVCHSCDNASCCNPKHLFLGTPRDNTQDSIAKGRWNKKRGKPKLTIVQVHEIRARRKNGESYRELALAYPACAATIGHAIHRRGAYKKIP